MKIYTRTGDDGATGLIGGQRVSKSNPRIDCIGAVDHLNAAIGFAAVPAPAELIEKLRTIQNDLFVIGSHLAAPDTQSPPGFLPALEETIVARLEMEIDAAEEQLPRLRNFVLPGGSEAAARLHLARTVCRDAERRLVNFAADRPLPAVMVTYLNRLSDWLFVHGRWANLLAAVPDMEWKPIRQQAGRPD